MSNKSKNNEKTQGNTVKKNVSHLASFSSFLAPTMAASSALSVQGFVRPLAFFSPAGFASFGSAAFLGILSVCVGDGVEKESDVSYVQR